MFETKKRITSILEDARRILGISRDEYALCSYAQYRTADTRQKISGWCCDSKDELADFIGITRRGLYKMLQRLEQMGLLEAGVGGAIRVTPRWIDAESKCELSSQNRNESVNLVHTDCELSSQNGAKSVNKVPEVNISKNISKSKVEEVVVPVALQTPAFLQQWETLLSMPKWKKKNPAAVAAALRQLGRFDAEFAAAQVECAIAGNWQGVVFTDTPGKYDEWKRKKTKPGEATTQTTVNRPLIRAGS